MPPTLVLVHGAFAESASWDRVIDLLQAAGHRVIAAANPLRGLTSDAVVVSDLVRTIDGPVVLVGHSYGGAVISNVDADAGDIVGLVYVAGFAPERGESCITLGGMFPGSTLGEALQPVLRSDGTTDLSIRVDRFHDQFAADVPAADAARMAPRSGRSRRRPSARRPASARSGASGSRGSCSARRTATSRRPSGTTWPSAPAPAAPSRSRAPRTPCPSPIRSSRRR
jgi:pimeloyl-ACP methyl ester carboxylesterase